MARNKKKTINTTSSSSLISNKGFVKPPVVVVMGHVDHGKTSLLDYIRKSRVALGESGSITQHVGAYQVELPQVQNNQQKQKNSISRKITFIDTPGHEAFTNLRSRGAGVADIALLVIDAKESVKPQTVESIKIIKKAGIPMIVVLNKMDLPDANPAKVKRDLLQHDVIVDENGGNIATAEISTKTGKGIDDLLEIILFLSEMKNISADPQGKLLAVVIETRKDPGRGNVATVIVQEGTLSIRDKLMTKYEEFFVRAMFNEYGKGIQKALPGAPVEVLGFNTSPEIGTVLTTSGKIEMKPAEAEKLPENQEDIMLRIYVKADTYGSLEAITQGLPGSVLVAKADIGEITDSDVALAKTMDMVMIGFNVKVSSRVMKLAKDEGVRVRSYAIIYKLFEEIEEVVEMLSIGPRKEIIGQAKIIKSFETSDGEVAGCHVIEGRLARGDKVLILRNDKEILENIKIKALRENKDEVTKMQKGKMCGVLFASDVDFKVGDMIQSYTLYEF